MFSIIAVDYDGSITPEERKRFLDSLRSQIFEDFELILLHDGQRKYDISKELYDLNVVTEESLFRGNVWGHNLRSRGIQLAKGKYILHTNVDNLYYPEALWDLYQSLIPGVNIYIPAVKMMGLNYSEGKICYDNPRDYKKFHILHGYPRKGSIDMMQLVTTKELWDSINGWYNITEQSDGIIYEELCKYNTFLMLPFIIGEHY